MPDPDHAAIRLALTTIPPACRFHGTNLNPTSPTREACCDTGKPALRRRAALEALDRLERAAAAPPTPDTGSDQRCRNCARLFDPDDTTFDGAAQSGTSPWCRGCVDSCHDNEIADHRCPVCSIPTKASI
jgi:hypothetical protein